MQDFFFFFFLFCLLKSSSQYNDTCGFQLTSREESENRTDEVMYIQMIMK